MSNTNLATEYQRLRAEAEQLAGGLDDIPRRATVLHHLYQDSGGNHVFALIAAHGALWAYRFFEIGGRLGRLVAQRYFYSSRERDYRLGLLNSFAEGFRAVNRTVCMDTYTNYYFTRQYGHHPRAGEFVRPELLEAFNLLHAATRDGRPLDEASRRHVFQQSFLWEQELTVAPGVAVAVAGFDCPILRALCLKPIVRFAYFPRWQYILFRDFSEKSERIAKGMRAYDVGARQGWQRVVESMRHYRLLPEEFWQAPTSHFAALRTAALMGPTAV